MIEVYSLRLSENPNDYSKKNQTVQSVDAYEDAAFKLGFDI
jgi:hypothetical protein